MVHLSEKLEQRSLAASLYLETDVLVIGGGLAGASIKAPAIARHSPPLPVTAIVRPAICANYIAHRKLQEGVPVWRHKYQRRDQMKQLLIE